MSINMKGKWTTLLSSCSLSVLVDAKTTDLNVCLNGGFEVTFRIKLNQGMKNKN